MASEEEVEMSKKKTKLSLLPYDNSLFSSLPNELVVNCFARVSKWYYPSLSLVSKSFRSLILSPELYVARSQIGTTEICLYTCLRFSTVPSMNPTRRWFNLWIKPNRNLTDGKIKEKSSGNLFVPFYNSSPPYSKSTVTVGSEIYVFGGSMDDNFGPPPSSAVRVYDCRKDTWRDDVPNMKMERKHALACVLDDKIYVMGGCNSEQSSWFEMFDIKSKTWKALPTNLDLQVKFGDKVRKIDVMEEKIYVKTEFGVKNWIYDVKEGRWSDTEGEMNIMWPDSWCVIDNVMFCYAFTTFKWYDLEARKWRDVLGLQGLRKYRSCVGFPNYSMVELVNYGGKLAILWDRFERPGRSFNKNIWCSVVRLEKCYGGIVGKIEWVDVVLTVPRSYNFLRCLAISI